ncbi:MAG: ABC transporter ATP-binding protein [Bacteroidales bacterium]|jgi:zinc transport system ATP-binding protein|nr:ABC transporter ATP-binding protein [Bacteroidales bacterium]
MAVLLEMRSLNAGYDDKIVLEDINFSVSENDFIGVIGPNGGGKTTLLRLILGLIKPFNGKLEYDSSLFGSIGYLPQISTGDAQYPVTVTDVILSGMMISKKIISRMSSTDRKRAQEIIEELGLGGMEKASLTELSGGQIQRVLLGRAIIGNPRLLLLDEPGNFVDSTFEKDFYEKLKELNGRMSILMVSHDIGIISSHVRSYACVNRKLHYHPSSEITNEQLLAYGCPIQLITHGVVPHTVLKSHA